MAVRFYISTEEASFFNNNRMGYGDSIPVEGTYRVGDFIISSTQSDGIFGWVCTKAGTPGEWEVIGSGAAGCVIPTSKVVGYFNTVTFSDVRNRVEIGIENFDSTIDFLEVHYNGLLLSEGVHYSISNDGLAIEKIEGNWNNSAYEDQQMIFRVLKSEGMNVTQFRNTVTLDTETLIVPMGIDNYRKNEDILEVHLNGVLLVEGLDYEVANNQIVKIDQTEAWNPYNIEGQKMFIQLIRNKEFTFEVTDGSIGRDKLDPEILRDVDAVGAAADILELHTEKIEAFEERLTIIEEGGNLEELEATVKANKDEVGVIDELTTEDKSSIVAAINELNNKIGNVNSDVLNAYNNMADYL